MRPTGCRGAIEVLLSPLQSGGERPGEGGRLRTQFDPVRIALKFSPLREERAGRGRGRGTAGRSSKPA
jgi:hypothetical protein